MTRREFPTKVRVAVIKRASDEQGRIFCEACGALVKRFQIDHIRPDGLLGEPTQENAQLLGECCFAPKNAKDTADIARAKRREAIDKGAKVRGRWGAGRNTPFKAKIGGGIVRR